MSDRNEIPRTLMATLIRKTGEKGSYFVGFAGPMMLTLSKLPEPDDQGREVWALKCSNPPRKPKPDEAARPRSDDLDRRAKTASQAFDRRDPDVPF